MKRIGILGGTFDPVHCGHMIIARAALEQYELDGVLVMTGGNPPHKQDRMVTPASMRHEMVKLAAEGEERIIPFDFEAKKTEPSYTVKTLTELRSLHPDTEYYFIIGEDSLRDIPKWYKPEEIARLCVFLAYPRGADTDIEALAEKRRREFDADIRLIDAPILGIASTKLRERVAEGKSIRYFVPDKVLRYIEEKGIYEQKRDAGEA